MRLWTSLSLLLSGAAWKPEKVQGWGIKGMLQSTAQRCKLWRINKVAKGSFGMNCEIQVQSRDRNRKFALRIFCAFLSLSGSQVPLRAVVAFLKVDRTAPSPRIWAQMGAQMSPRLSCQRVWMPLHNYCFPDPADTSPACILLSLPANVSQRHVRSSKSRADPGPQIRWRSPPLDTGSSQAEAMFPRNPPLLFCAGLSQLRAMGSSSG